MSVTINGTNGLTFNDGSSQQTAASGFGFKNRIINGAMQIDQRNAGASVTPTGSTYTLDRWQLYATQSSKVSIQQNAAAITPPNGFKNYLGLTSLSAYSVGASDYFSIGQPVEGYSMADFGWGTANAQTVTLSFWVRSSLTGTFGGSVGNASRSYPFGYTISAANSWEQKTITIIGDTVGTYNSTNGTGLYLFLTAAAGSSMVGTANSWQSGLLVAPTGQTSVVGTNGATFYITGVQLEKGSTATSFDYRPYGTELALCQRYYWKTYEQQYAPGTSALYAGTGTVILAPDASCNACHNFASYPVTMRAAPTVVGYSPNNGNTSNPIWDSGANVNKPWNAFCSNTNGLGYHVNASVATGATCYVHWTASAEL